MLEWNISMLRKTQSIVYWTASSNQSLRIIPDAVLIFQTNRLWAAVCSSWMEAETLDTGLADQFPTARQGRVAFCQPQEKGHRRTLKIKSPAREIKSL